MAPKIDTSGFRRFMIMLYKGLLLRKRHFIITAFEIIFPVVIASIVAIIQSEANIPSSGGNKPGWVNATTFDPFDPLVQRDSYSQILFAYTPPNVLSDKLMDESIRLFKEKNPYFKSIENKSLENADILETYCMNEQRDRTSLIVVGTIFHNIPPGGNKFPAGLDYTIRYSGSSYGSNFKTNLKYRFSFDRFSSYDQTYTSTYFLTWQASVEKSFIKQKHLEVGKSFDYELLMQQFPYPGYKEKQGPNISILIPILMIYGFIVFIINIMRRVIEEKSNGSKELLKMMGMTNFVYWISTFMNFFSIGAIVMFIIAIIYKIPLKNSVVVMENSNFFLILIFFLLYIASLILFCLACTTIFNKAVFGVIALIIVYNTVSSLMSSLIFPFMDIEIKYFPLSHFVKLCICLFPPGAMFSAFQIISPFEAAGQGVQWSNLYSLDAVPDLNFSHVLLTMLFSCFMYSVIIWYVDAVWPWQLGVPKPFYFPFTKGYWFGYQEKKTNEILLGPENDVKSTDFFEDDPTGISPGVVVNNLSKVFKTGFQNKVAVKNMSLNIYSGQITALLGHNGAGKTTTINILTGLYSPSGGSASINGWDIFSETSKARESLGVCPQHNVLFDTLTVDEHLRIYAGLKGVSCGRMNEEILGVLNILHLNDKRYELTKNLSGGMKRKLSLAIAVIGGSKVLFLDEPTSGLDVEARRSVWDALLQIRHNRTIILTTHYMEEADILGDRIAIMAEGEIQCCGSPLFLKKKFGTGYHMHVVKNQNYDINGLSALLEEYVPGAKLENDYEREATFNLMANTNSSFGPLFEKIELYKEKLGVNSCGITVTTMEDVFLNVTNIADLKLKDQNHTLAEEDETELRQIYMESSGVKKSHDFINKFLGLIIKRVHYSKRHWSIAISQLVLPFLLMCACLYTIKATSYSTSQNFISLKLSIKEVYGKTDGFYKSNQSPFTNNIKEVFESNDINAKNLAQDDPEKYVINYGEQSLIDYYKKLITGATAKGKPTGELSLTAWYNGLPYHSAPMSLLYMNTAILRQGTDSGFISLTNYPLPRSDNFYSEDPSHMAERILANVFVPLALSFLTSSFVLVPIQERTSKAKLLQLMTGIHAAFYWLAMFLWDFCMSFIVSILLIIPFAIFGHYAFFAPHSEAIGTAFLMMIFYSWASIPFSYIFTLIFKKPNTGFSVVNAVCIITGVAAASILSTVMLAVGDENKTVKVFFWLFKIFPSFSLSSGFGNLFSIAYANAYCDTLSPKDLKYNCDPRYIKPYNTIFKCCKEICGSNCFNQTHPINFEKTGCAPDILFLFVEGFVYFTLLLFFESAIMASIGRIISQKVNRLRRRVISQFIASNFVEDTDVLHEEERIRNNYLELPHSEALVAINLMKEFKGLKAVDGLTFGIHREECFGLLGVNGAGKTTTFRMLTGDCYPTQGNAFIGSCSVITHLKQFQSHVGYCPQFDPLIDRLSGREMITLFARLRGLSGYDMIRTVNSLIKMTDLTKHADKPSMVYSGGNKRKLSIALALIGSPPLLLLDEPTAGVDPVSRRKIWKILSMSRIHTGAAVILTTHSMEESEALCSRLAIMVNGRFRCLGSIQQLKSKFGQGYTLIIKMKREELSIPTSMNAIKAYIDTNLPGAQLKDDHQGMLQYHVVDATVTLGYLFRFMDDMKEKCNLEDYVVSDTSLEQIFLAFARSQRVVAVN